MFNGRVLVSSFQLFSNIAEKLIALLYSFPDFCIAWSYRIFNVLVCHHFSFTALPPPILGDWLKFIWFSPVCFLTSAILCASHPFSTINWQRWCALSHWHGLNTCLYVYSPVNLVCQHFSVASLQLYVPCNAWIILLLGFLLGLRLYLIIVYARFIILIV